MTTLEPWVQDCGQDGVRGESSPLNLDDKAALRRMLRARRGSVDAQSRRRAACALVKRALRHRLIAHGRRVGFYMPAKAEIDTLPLLARARAMGAECFLPVLAARDGRRLWFAQLGARPRWTVNRYGIAEPVHPRARRLRARQLDTLFLPLLGFDRAGWRIGMGGGYYDASLAYLLGRRHWRKPRLIGVAFATQEIPAAPRDPWDVPLDGVLTECEFVRARRRGQYR